MRVLSFGLDSSVTEEGSKTATRAREYGGLVDAYVAIAPVERDVSLKLSDKAQAYGICGRGRAFALWRIWRFSCDLLKKEKFDVVSTSDVYFLGFVAYLVSHRAGTGFEMQVHGFEKKTFIRGALSRFLLGRADSIRVVSERLKRVLGDIGISSEKITVAPIFVDCALFIPRMHSGEKEYFTFMSVGRLVPVKRFDLLLRAFKEVSEEYPNARLIIAGEGGERQKLETLAHGFGLAERVRFVGFHNNLPELFAECDSFVLSSDSEGYGIAPIEAACNGLPVIMTDVGCAGEIFEHEKNALIVPVGDASALAAMMARIMEDDHMRARLLKENARIRERLLPQKEIFDRILESWRRAAGKRI
ncbi:glycosyltransferase [bacterium]|nr:glycosyltransferase [bacterium]